MVFPAALLSRVGYFQGLNYDYPKYLGHISRNCRFLKRSHAETNSTYKQIIPYAILIYKEKVFRYKRGRSLTERRLHDFYSIGVGGHVSKKSSGDFHQLCRESLEREIEEELILECSYENKLSALLNDDSNEVGKVHLGIIHLLSLKEERAKGKEEAIREAGFVNIDSLSNNLHSFENWSKICIGEIWRLIGKKSMR